ncbi:MAG: hypothetical protein K0B37_14210 [Bacteroidales bacterium]|nr:hypothetical protein [Bacteroidales bacterium]
MKSTLLFFMIITALTIKSQTLKYYDENGFLKINNNYRINLEQLEQLKSIENYFFSVIAPTIEFTQGAIETGYNAHGIIEINKTDNNVKINLKEIEGPFLFTHDEFLKKIQPMLAFLTAEAFNDEIKYYLPYEFIFGVDTDSNDNAFSIIYPGNQAEMFINENGTRAYIFKDEKQLSTEEIIEIDKSLSEKFEQYIKTRKSGMIGIAIVGKDEIQDHLRKTWTWLDRRNRSYHIQINENGLKLLKIVFSNTTHGLHGIDIIEFSIDEDLILRYYQTVTH